MQARSVKWEGTRQKIDWSFRKRREKVSLNKVIMAGEIQLQAIFSANHCQKEKEIKKKKKNEMK